MEHLSLKLFHELGFSDWDLGIIWRCANPWLMATRLKVTMLGYVLVF